MTACNDPRDVAKEAHVAWLKARAAHRPIDALQIESRYGLEGLPAPLITAGLEAAAAGRDIEAAIEDNQLESSPHD